MAGFLTTHVLDTARGCPAPGIKIEHFLHKNGGVNKINEAVTNADGRTDSPILPQGSFETGKYELIFYAGEYLRATDQAGVEPIFLDEIPIRFAMAIDNHYHVPLLLTAHGYSTYRGS